MLWLNLSEALYEVAHKFIWQLAKFNYLQSHSGPHFPRGVVPHKLTLTSFCFPFFHTTCYIHTVEGQYVNLKRLMIHQATITLCGFTQLTTFCHLPTFLVFLTTFLSTPLKMPSGNVTGRNYKKQLKHSTNNFSPVSFQSMALLCLICLLYHTQVTTERPLVFLWDLCGATRHGQS